MNPRVLVVMPVFDASRWVERAMRSILRQALEDFRLLVIDDGSTDDSARIAERLAATDDRVLVWRQSNAGPGAAMNRALSFALEERIPFVARMDADDLSERDRLRLQVERLESAGALAACGANCHYISENDERIIGTSTVPLASRHIARELRWGLRGMVQGATVFRTEALARVGGYRSQFPLAEDADLFLRLSEHFELANRPEFLYRIRLRESSLSLANFERNHSYAAYALDCAAHRKEGEPELSFEEFNARLSALGRLASARDRFALRLWQRSRARASPTSLLVALLLDPRRALARALRALERRVA